MIQGRPLPRADLKLPRIKPALADMWTRLARAQLEGELLLFGRSLSYTAADPMVSFRGVGVVADVRVGDMSICLAATVDLVSLLPGADVSTEPFHEMSAARMALVVEHILSQEIQALENAWGTTIQIQSVDCEGKFRSNGPLIMLNVQGDGLSQTPVFMTSQDADRLVTMLERAHPPRGPRRLESLPIVAAWLGPITIMRREEIRAIRTGDVIFPSNEWSNVGEHGHALIAHTHIVPIHAANGGFVIAESEDEDTIGAMIQKIAKGNAMKESDAKQIGSASDPRMLVTIELDRQDMTVSDLENLQKGAVLPFDRDNVDEVLLCADGMPIAAGRLVQLDDVIGVQVTRLI